MSFDWLPDEIVRKLFIYLSDDTRSFINLASISKRFEFISRSLTTSPSWIEQRPVGFNLDLSLNLYKPNYCKKHGACDEQEWRTGSRCEFAIRSRHTSNNVRSPSATENLNDPNCYYHRLFCLANATHRNFSRIKFLKARLSDRGCFKSFQDSLKLNKSLAEQNIRALVELELYECDIALDWLNTALNHLDGIRYLTLSGVTFTDPSILVEPRFFASKTLKELKITNDRYCRMSDYVFMYFLENFPAIEFDLSSTHVEFHRRIIQRFYTNGNTVESYTAKPSDEILTFPMVLLYLKKYQSIVKHFIANETNMTFTCLKRMLQDDELKHLKISVKNCPMITQLERDRLSEQVEIGDMARVVF